MHELVSKYLVEDKTSKSIASQSLNNIKARARKMISLIHSDHSNNSLLNQFVGELTVIISDCESINRQLGRP